MFHFPFAPDFPFCAEFMSCASGKNRSPAYFFSRGLRVAGAATEWRRATCGVNAHRLTRMDRIGGGAGVTWV